MMKINDFLKKASAVLVVAVLTISAIVVPLSVLNNVSASDGEMEVDYTLLDRAAVTSLNNSDYHVLDFSAVVVEYNGRYPGGKQSLLSPGYAYLIGVDEGGMENPYVTYNVKGGTDFMLECLVNRRDTLKKGNEWRLKVYTSENGYDWNEIIPEITDKSGLQEAQLDRTLRFEKKLSENDNYVMAVFPHTGNAAGKAYMDPCGNDFMGISKVKFTPADDPYEGTVYEKKLDFGALPATANVSKENKSDYYINDCKGLAVERRYRQTDDKSYQLGANWNYIYYYDYGTVEKPYATFSVEGGTDFRLVCYSNYKLTKSVADRLGEADWRLHVYTSVNGLDWVDIEPKIDTINKLDSNLFNQILTFSQKLSTDVKFVKAEFPHAGNASGYAQGLAGNNFMGIKSIYFTPDKDKDKEDYKYTYTKYYRYNKLSTTELTDELFKEKYGLDRGDGVRVFCSELTSGNYLGVSEKYLSNKSNKVKPNAVYHIAGDTDFKLTVSYDPTAVKAAAAELKKDEKDYSVKFYTSLDGINWQALNIQPSSTVTGDLGRNDIYRFVFPGDAALLKVEFPQSIGQEKYSECVGIKEIALTPGIGKIGYYEKYYSFSSVENIDSISEQKAKDLYMYTQSNMACNKFGKDSKVYLCANWWYLYNNINVSNPFVVYNVKPSTDFKAVVARSVENCTAIANRLGISPDEWTIKFYTSADAKKWNMLDVKPVSTVNSAIGKDDIYEFEIGKKVKYIKIVFPQTGNCDGTPGKGLAGNDFIGISQLGFTPGDDNFYNPYGNYKFANTVDFSKMKNSMVTAEVANNSGIYQCEPQRLAVSGGSLQVNYEYLRLFEKLDKPYVVYSVKPGTTFQAVVNYSATREAMSIATGEDFSIRLYISQDNVNWSSADTIITNSVDSEIYTIKNLPTNVKFVKIEFPQNGDMSLLSNGITPYVGNDFVGVKKVSYTSGNNVRKVGDVSGMSFTDKYDFAKDEIDVSKFDSTGIVYAKGLGQITSSWPYFYFSSFERDNPFIILPVRGGSSFYTSTSMRTMQAIDFTKDEFSFKILLSTDRVNWSDVTEQIKKSYYSNDGNFVVSEYAIESLAKNIRYIKIQFPQRRNYTDYTTSKGRKQGYVGNDFCGIDKLYFNKCEYSQKYENYLDYTKLAQSKTGLEGSVDSDRAGTLGIYDYDASALELTNMGDALNPKFVIHTQQSYIFNKTDVVKPFIVYNVKPGTAFESGFYLPDDPAILRICSSLGLGDDLKIKVYSSSDNKNWKEIKRETYNYVYSETDMKNEVVFKCDNVGADTNYLKIEFPLMGDYKKITGDINQATGEMLFGVSYIKCSLKEYNDTFTPVQYTFLDPNLFNIDMSKDPILNYRPVKQGLQTWQMALIVSGAIVLCGGTVLAVFLAIKKKKNKTPKD